jgi:hypothetical protein
LALGKAASDELAATIIPGELYAPVINFESFAPVQVK